METHEEKSSLIFLVSFKGDLNFALIVGASKAFDLLGEGKYIFVCLIQVSFELCDLSLEEFYFFMDRGKFFPIDIVCDVT